MGYTKHEWKQERYFNFKYAKYLPKDFDENKKYPLVIFLHGAGERSNDDLDIGMRHGYMKYIREENREYPFICVAPLCPEDKYWGCYTESLIAFIDYIEETLPIDKSRIYLTGLSMGGTGTYMLAMADRDRYAALMPVCGSGIYWYAHTLKNIPIYICHGDCDEIVPIVESVNMLNQINGAGGNAKLKICYGVKHDCWDIAYTDEEMLDWLLSQKKK